MNKLLLLEEKIQNFQVQIFINPANITDQELLASVVVEVPGGLEPIKSKNMLSLITNSVEVN